MRGAIKWMAGNHVAANLLMMVLLVGGLIKAFSIKQEIFPEISLDMIQVQVPYPGAGPEEVEEGIILKIEDNITSVDGIKEIRSTATEGMGVVTAELVAGHDPDVALQEIKSEVDRIITFPEEAEKPIISKLINRIEVISLVLYGDVPERSLREQAELIREELLAFPQITQVDLGGLRPYEISIEVPEKNLRRYGLTLEHVAGAVRLASLDLPGGTIKTEGGEILLRTKEKRYTGTEYEQITIIGTGEGARVKLGDIAEVRDAFRETDMHAEFNGRPAAMIKVFRVGEQKPTEISDLVIGYAEEKSLGLPGSMSLDVWYDTTEIYNSRVNLLIKNAAIGLTLVMIVLGLFLEIRLALWVMLGLPISFLGAMFIMPWLGVSINMMSLFAFILALGIVVDDAIIVGENIYEHRQMGKPFPKAAVDGALEVAMPITFSILTTLVAFMPLVFISGLMGKFIKTIPLVVMSILTVSLIESLLVLPAHLSIGKHRLDSHGLLGMIDNTRKRVSRWLDEFTSGPYSRALDICLRYRYATLAAGFATLVLTVGLIRGGIVKFSFMPRVDGDQVNVNLQMPPGTPAYKTAEITEYIVAKGREVMASHDSASGRRTPTVESVFAIVGGSLGSGGPHGASGGEATAANLSEVSMMMVESDERDISSVAVENLWRQRVGEIPGVESITYTSNLMQMGANIDVQLAHNDFGVLESASERLQETLRDYPGVSDIKDNYSKGKPELKFTLKPAARTLGITERDLAVQVRGAFYGAEARRQQIGRNEVKVMVRYPADDRKSIWDLDQMRIRTPGGGELPLEQAAYIEESRGYNAINRVDRKRTVNVQGTVDAEMANSGEILADIQATVLPQLIADYPGLSYELVGEERERAESMASTAEGFLLALLAIYALLAIPFHSYSQPLLIMAAIPFGFVGAVIGHLIMGYDLSMLSMFGVVALAGVVVNDSLLLIYQINKNRKQGKEILPAVMAAGRRRLRPIVLTSFTTFFGLMPIILETSVQAQFLIPMALSLGFGILFATMITLLLIPSMYIILEDLRRLIGLGAGQREYQPVEVVEQEGG
ncbi:MAG: efflux RND transporter permease subunit [Candidatus Glassbacteria bacterium]|nr:efflux RND transporter permease subunit [Candidatus Glassbacteria bacterium]